MSEENKKLVDAYEVLLNLLKNRNISLMHACDAAFSGDDGALQDKLNSELSKSILHLANLDDLCNWLKNGG